MYCVDGGFFVFVLVDIVFYFEGEEYMVCLMFEFVDGCWVVDEFGFGMVIVDLVIGMYVVVGMVVVVVGDVFFLVFVVYVVVVVFIGLFVGESMVCVLFGENVVVIVDV